MELKEALNDHRLRAELLPRLLVPRKAHDYKARPTFNARICVP
jgi:hypothetical protein